MDALDRDRVDVQTDAKAIEHEPIHTFAPAHICDIVGWLAQSMTHMSDFQVPDLADSINGQAVSSSTRILLGRAGLPAIGLADRITMSPEIVHEAADKSFSHYQQIMGNDSNFCGNSKELAIADDGHTKHGRILGTYESPAKEASVPYNLAVRLANRSNGAPLATIIEQGSYSTLNSRGSLFSVGQFPSLKAGENASPGRAPHRKSRSLDEIVFQKVRAGVDQDRDIHRITSVHVKPCDKDEYPNQPSPFLAPVTPLFDSAIEIPKSQAGGPRNVRDIGGPKRFLQSVLQNVRSASQTRTRSRSSSASGEKMVDGTRGRHQQAFQPPCTRTDMHRDFIAKCVPESNRFANGNSPLSANSIPHTRTRKMSGVVASGPSAHNSPLPPSPSASIRGAEPILASDFHLRPLPPAAVTRSHEGSSFVFPKPRDGALSSRLAEAQTVSSTNTAVSSAQPTSESIVREQVSSLKAPSFVKDATRNGSRCSTLSTSYSGTVLGVDLDLQSDHFLASCASRSSTPIWFTPQLAELELQASCSDSSGTQPSPENVPSQRSVTSSALTSLLPIAVASGIVRPNYDTPKISFFSPSGNLIQPEESPVPSTRASKHGGSPPPRATYSDCSAIGGLHYQTMYPSPTRPALVPMTTPPMPKVSLPVHLQHHHNFQQPEKSQISSCESLIVLTPAVKGCHGIVQNQSLTPRSGVPHVSGEPKLARHEKWCSSILGPLAAHLLRICFCQPIDEAGTSTSTCAPGIGGRRSASTTLIGRPDREALLGTRVVDVQHRSRATASAAGRSALHSNSAGGSHAAVKRRARERSYQKDRARS